MVMRASCREIDCLVDGRRGAQLMRSTGAELATMRMVSMMGVGAACEVAVKGQLCQSQKRARGWLLREINGALSSLASNRSPETRGDTTLDRSWLHRSIQDRPSRHGQCAGHPWSLLSASRYHPSAR